MSPLALVLDRVLDEDDELSELIEGRIVNIFYLFSQAENYVKEVVADRVVLKRGCFRSHSKHIVLISNRRAQRSPTYDSGSSDHHAEIYQKSFDAVNNTRQPARRQCHRTSDRSTKLKHEESPRSLP